MRVLVLCTLIRVEVVLIVQGGTDSLYTHQSGRGTDSPCTLIRVEVVLIVKGGTGPVYTHQSGSWY